MIDYSKQALQYKPLKAYFILNLQFHWLKVRLWSFHDLNVKHLIW